MTVMNESIARVCRYAKTRRNKKIRLRAWIINSLRLCNEPSCKHLKPCTKLPMSCGYNLSGSHFVKNNMHFHLLQGIFLWVIKIKSIFFYVKLIANLSFFCLTLNQARSQRGAKGQCPLKLKLCLPPKLCSRPTTNKTKCRPIVLTSTPYSSESLSNAMPFVTLTSCPFSLFTPPVKNPLKCPASLTECGTGRLNDIWALCRLWV